MRLSPFVDEQNRTRCYVLGSESWDEFYQLVSYVRQSLDGIVTEKVDGPASRVWTVAGEDRPLVFTHNDMLGNCFFCEEEDAAPELLEVVQLLESAEL